MVKWRLRSFHLPVKVCFTALLNQLSYDLFVLLLISYQLQSTMLSNNHIRNVIITLSWYTGVVESDFTGDFKGYGFVEFAHNRATLKKVQNSINGSILEGHTLHCGLVSEHLLSYEHTLSKTLYCISESKSLQLSSTLLHLAQVFPLVSCCNQQYLK